MLFRGCATALATPFKGDKVDWDALERLLQSQLEAGIDALVACGTTGEPATMTVEEQLAVTKFVVANSGAVPVIAGIGGNNTANVKVMAARMADAGADALLAVTPYYNKTTQAGLVAHYFAVADSTELPIVLYNVPARTGLNLLPETTLRLSEHPQIVALKEANPDLGQMMEDARLLQGKLDLYSGNDDCVYPLMTLGASGVISVASNLIPEVMRSIVTHYDQGDTQASLAVQLKYAELIRLLFRQVNPIPIKWALAAVGLGGPDVRLPLIRLTDEEAEPLRGEMETLGLL